MKKFLDKQNKQLLFLGHMATPEYWDSQWNNKDLKKYVRSGKHETFVYPTTKQYLPIGSKILEGGSGQGQFVYSLDTRGYDAYGIDFAPDIIKKTQTLFPKLKISSGDVRHIDFPDNYFDGYWSLGVIEHFPGGFVDILNEMHRVVRPGGYVFLTFPHMSKLRRLKAKWNRYPILDKNSEWEKTFYQYALREESVIEKFMEAGFEIVKKKPFDGLKGAKDELPGIICGMLGYFYYHQTFCIKALSYLLTRILAPFTSHAILLILKKKETMESPLPKRYDFFSDRKGRAAFIANTFSEELSQAKSVLDVGCDYNTLKHILGSKVTGVDLHGNPDYTIDLERERLSRFKDGEFDFVVCTEVLEHLNNFYEMLDELSRVSNHHILISVPNCMNLFTRFSILFNGDAGKFYGLPFEKPSDRHHWFFNHFDISRFFQNYIRKKSFVIDRQFLHCNYNLTWKGALVRAVIRIFNIDSASQSYWILISKKI